MAAVSGLIFEFEIGEIVFLKTDTDMLARLLTGYTIRQNGNIQYGLSLSDNETWHWDFEITRTP